MAEKQPVLVDANALASAFMQAAEGLRPKVELTEGSPEYQARLREEGFMDDFFGVKVFQNGYEAQARGIPEETRRRVGQLKPGKYLKGRVTVDIHQNGEVVRLLYPTTGDNMMKNQALWKDFPDLVNQIWNEQQATSAA